MLLSEESDRVLWIESLLLRTQSASAPRLNLSVVVVLFGVLFFSQTPMQQHRYSPGASVSLRDPGDMGKCLRDKHRGQPPPPPSPLSSPPSLPSSHLPLFPPRCLAGIREFSQCSIISNSQAFSPAFPTVMGTIHQRLFGREERSLFFLQSPHENQTQRRKTGG